MRHPLLLLCRICSEMVVPRRARVCSSSEAGSYLKHIDSCVTQLKAEGPSRTCSESTEFCSEVLTGHGPGRALLLASTLYQEYEPCCWYEPCAHGPLSLATRSELFIPLQVTTIYPENSQISVLGGSQTSIFNVPDFRFQWGLIGTLLPDLIRL